MPAGAPDLVEKTQSGLFRASKAKEKGCSFASQWLVWLGIPEGFPIRPFVCRGSPGKDQRGFTPCENNELLIFGDRTDRARGNRVVDGTFIGDRSGGGLSLSVIPKFENGGDGGHAESASDAKIFVDFNFLSHDYFLQSGNIGIIGYQSLFFNIWNLYARSLRFYFFLSVE
jgi:hypothetical protein